MPPPLAKAFRTYRLLLGVVFIVWPLLLLQITYTFPRFRPPPGSNAMANVFATTGTSWNAVDSSSTDTKAREALEEQPKFTADGLNDWLTGSIHAVEHTDGDDGEDGDAQAELDDPGPIRSQVLIHASSSGTGLLNKYFYRFQDVQLSSDGVTVFYDPDTFDPPYQPYWVDMVSGNGSLPYLPTRFVIKGDTHNIQWFYLPVEYVPYTSRQPKCTTWVEPLTYLLQVRYSYNIWHTWNEGVMGIFQTLRELGQLPLASVGKGGELTEIVDGMGPDGCPWVYDSMTGTVVQQERCPPRDGLLESERCDPKADAWCRPGAVVSMRRRKGGPVILPYTALSLMNVWSHLYSSMTEDVRDITTLQGACFRDLVIGKSSTLNFYQAINSTEPDQRALEMFPRIDNLASRVEAMAVFKAFVTSAQREWVEAGVEKTGQRWQGYASEAMERLRRGVGPEDLDTGVLDGLKVTAVPGMLREEIVELKKLYNKRAQASLRAAAQFQKLYGTAAEWRRKAEKEGLLDEEWDYYDDDEAIAALELKKLAAAKKSGASGGERGHERIGNASDRKGERRARTLLSSAYALKAPIGKNVSASNGIAVEAPGRTVLSRAGGTPRWFDKSAVFRHETPRPVVTYMSRNFFSRGVLNERDLLEYVLTRYNVTLRVTTFEEPLLEVMEMLGSSDVMFGMHGAGWTNALFIKRGATTMQMFPYGWRLPDGSTVRGFNYREIVYASECPYQEWVSQSREHAFFRRIDYRKKPDLTYSLHPDPSWPLPSNSWPGNPWIYQNTYVDMDDFGPALDAMMKKAGIAPMPGLRRGDELGSERID